MAKNKLAELLSRREKLQGDLAQARKSSPEATIAAQLAATEAELEAAKAEDERRQFAEKQAEIDALGAELEAEAGRIISELERLYAKVDDLTARYNAAFAAVTTGRNSGRLHLGRASDYGGIFAMLQKLLFDYLKRLDFTNRDLLKNRY